MFTKSTGIVIRPSFEDWALKRYDLAPASQRLVELWDHLELAPFFRIFLPPAAVLTLSAAIHPGPFWKQPKGHPGFGGSYFVEKKRFLGLLPHMFFGSKKNELFHSWLLPKAPLLSMARQQSAIALDPFLYACHPHLKRKQKGKTEEQETSSDPNSYTVCQSLQKDNTVKWPFGCPIIAVAQSQIKLNQGCLQRPPPQLFSFPTSKTEQIRYPQPTESSALTKSNPSCHVP